MSRAFLLLGQGSWSVASMGGWALHETMHGDVLVQGAVGRNLIAATHLRAGNKKSNMLLFGILLR